MLQEAHWFGEDEKVPGAAEGERKVLEGVKRKRGVGRKNKKRELDGNGIERSVDRGVEYGNICQSSAMAVPEGCQEGHTPRSALVWRG